MTRVRLQQEGAAVLLQSAWRGKKASQLAHQMRAARIVRDAKEAEAELAEVRRVDAETGRAQLAEARRVDAEAEKTRLRARAAATAVEKARQDANVGEILRRQVAQKPVKSGCCVVQ